MPFKKTRVPEPPSPTPNTNDWIKSMMHGAPETRDPQWSTQTITINVGADGVEIIVPVMLDDAPPQGWLHVRRNKKRNGSPFAFAMGNLAKHLDVKASQVVPHLNAALGIGGLLDMQRFADERKMGAQVSYGANAAVRSTQFLGFIDDTDETKLCDLYVRAETDDLRAFLAMCRLDFDKEPTT